MEKWSEEKRLLAVKYNDPVLDELYHRCAAIGFRFGCLMHILQQGEEALKEGEAKKNGTEYKRKNSSVVVDTAVMMAEYALAGQLRFFGAKKVALIAAHPIPAAPKKFSWEDLIREDLPETFTFEEVQKAYEKRKGKKGKDLKHRLRDQVDNGIITKINNNTWKRL